jgi:transcriptional regulator with XRE-family HTH domain
MARRKPKTEEESRFNYMVGLRIEAGRKKALLTQAQLAQAVGISRAQLGFYESGDQRCPPYRLAGIAYRLGVEVSNLIPKVTTHSMSREAGCAASKTV